MANTLKLGAGKWATGTDTVLAFNDENNNFKPLPFDFSRASSATVVNQSGLIETVGSGTPRIDFQGNTKGALLLEPTRTNTITYSNDFTLGGWQPVRTTVTSNYGISPDGTQNSTKLVFGDANDYINRATQSSGIETSSIYVKGIKGETIKFGKGGNVASGPNHTLTGDWQRLTDVTEDAGTAFHISTFGGVTAREVEVFGAVQESGSYASSYIPTSGSAVTRVAETSSQTVPDGVIGQTEGTMFCEISEESLQENSRYMSISVFNDPNKRLTIYQSGAVTRLINVYCSAGATFNFQYNPPNGRLKIAVGYKSGQYVLYVNGINAATSTESAVVACSDLGLGVNEYLGTANPPSVGYSQVVLYNTRLSNAELQALTTI